MLRDQIDSINAELLVPVEVHLPSPARAATAPVASKNSPTATGRNTPANKNTSGCVTPTVKSGQTSSTGKRTPAGSLTPARKHSPPPRSLPVLEPDYTARHSIDHRYDPSPSHSWEDLRPTEAELAKIPSSKMSTGRPSLPRQNSLASNNPFKSMATPSLVPAILRRDSILSKAADLDDLDHPTQPEKPEDISIAERLGLGIRDEEEFREFTIFNAFMTNLRVCPVDLSGNYYYLEHRSFLPNTPGAILHAGNDKEGPTRGVAHLPYMGSNRIGLGNFETDQASVIWERFAKTTFWTHMKYEFEFGCADGVRRKFNWIRTRNMVLDDQGDLVLVQEGRESLILAEYLGKGLLKWKKRGRLRIRPAENLYGELWETMVLLSWAAVLETSRRRARQRRLSALHLL